MFATRVPTDRPLRPREHELLCDADVSVLCLRCADGNAIAALASGAYDWPRRRPHFPCVPRTPQTWRSCCLLVGGLSFRVKRCGLAQRCSLPRRHHARRPAAVACSRSVKRACCGRGRSRGRQRNGCGTVSRPLAAGGAAGVVRGACRTTRVKLTSDAGWNNPLFACAAAAAAAAAKVRVGGVTVHRKIYW